MARFNICIPMKMKGWSALLYTNVQYLYLYKNEGVVGAMKMKGWSALLYTNVQYLFPYENEGVVGDIVH